MERERERGIEGARVESACKRPYSNRAASKDDLLEDQTQGGSWPRQVVVVEQLESEVKGPPWRSPFG